MHPCRPVIWAEGTGFAPGYTVEGKIIIKIDVSKTESKELYQRLVIWMRRSTFPGATKLASTNVSKDLLTSLLNAK
jgi:hypothetical protein